MTTAPSPSAAAFEARYRADRDPWRTLTDPAERAKARRVVAACGDGPFASACELGAGVGGLTAWLAPRCAALLAIDAAPTAVAAATERLAPWPHARAVVGEIPRDLPDGRFDLVVASEVLYYLGRGELGAVLRWLDRALAPDARVVAVHWTGSAPDLRQDAHSVHAALAAVPSLHRLLTERGPTYRLDVLERA